MERHGHLQLAMEVREGLLAMSAATIDRALQGLRERSGSDPPPGFMEADLVAHSGPTARGSFVQTLTVTDIATGWTECAPVLVREQTLLTAVIGEVRKLLRRARFDFVRVNLDGDRAPFDHLLDRHTVKKSRSAISIN